MASFESNQIVNRDSAQHMGMSGYSPVLTSIPTPPPGPWILGPGEFSHLPELQENGCMIYMPTLQGSSNEDRFAQLYVFIEPPEGVDEPTWEFWKQVDLDWPKIDPRTGKPHDQYLEWYSPLAE